MAPVKEKDTYIVDETVDSTTQFNHVHLALRFRFRHISIIHARSIYRLATDGDTAALMARIGDTVRRHCHPEAPTTGDIALRA